MTSQIYSQTGALSDCKPAVFNGKATWYVTDGFKLTFYQINSDGSFSSEIGHMNTWKAIGNTKNTTYTDKKPGTATKYRIRAYRITNGKKIYGPYSSVRTVK